MVLRKPYAFLIKHFKLIHIIMSVLLVMLMMQTMELIGFVNKFVNSTFLYITKTEFSDNFSNLLIIVPIILFVFMLILFLVMMMKKKPSRFYLFSTLTTLLIFAIDLYGYSVLQNMITTIQDVRVLKALVDVLVFAVIAEFILSIVTIIRGVGFNISRFDFNSDLAEFDISEEDSAEFEVNIDFDLNDVKRNNNKRIRHLKYFYKENKTAIGGFVIFVIALISFFSLKSYLVFRKDTTTSPSLEYNGFIFKVNDVYIIDDDLNGEKIKDNLALVVVDADVTNSYAGNKEVFKTGTINLDVGGDAYSVVHKYDDYVLDLGKSYQDEEIVSGRTIRRLFIYEVPKNHLFSKMLIGVRDLGNSKTKYYKANPINLSGKKNKIEEKFLKEEMNLRESTIGELKFNIKKYSISDKHKITYTYCTSKKICINSVEYLVPKFVVSNYDKAILKISGNFNYDNSLNYKDFYALFNNFGYIEYKIDKNTYRQTSGFREIKSAKLKEKNTYYIEVNKEILKADSICLGLKIRNMNYRYYLK